MDDIETILADMRRTVEQLYNANEPDPVTQASLETAADLVKHFANRIEGCLPDA